nr:alanine-zipper protein [Geotalea toluenoxydans]
MQADAAAARVENALKLAEEREKAAAEREKAADEKAAKAEAIFQKSMRK